MPIVLSPAAVVGGPLSWAWVDAEAVTHALDGSIGYRVMFPSEGLFGPPAVLVHDPIPYQPGSRLRAVRVEARDFPLLILVTGSSAVVGESRLRDLINWFDPVRGDGRLQRTGRDANVRELVCRPERPDIREERDNALGLWARALFPMLALAPYWQDAADQTGSWTYTAGTASPTISNTGDADAWPVWTLTGPATNPTMTNTTTGLLLAITTTLSAGQTLVIDTREPYKSLTHSAAGAVIISTSSQLFPLVRGTNAVTVVATGTTGASGVAVAYRRRYNSP
jgi:hypothetical protein